MYQLLCIIAGCSLTVQATPGLVLPVERTTGLGCIPEGSTVSYECTVSDTSDPLIGSTVWLGSAFTCTSSEISFRHSSFEPNGVSGSCGDLSAMSVEVSGNEYTSRLTLTATTELNGRTIKCTLSSVVDFGSDTVKIGASPSPPQRTMVDITSTSSLTVSWAPPSNTSNVGGYMLTVTGEDCGCESMNISPSTTSVSCSGWTASGQTCSFEVRTVSQDCGFPSLIPVTTSVTLAVPASTSGLNVSPVYCLNGSVQYIDVAFMGVNAIIIGGGISDTISYTVMIGSQLFTGVQCSTSNQHCTLRVPGSQLTEDGLLIVNVVASNAVGNGNPVTFPMPVPTNLLGQVIVNVTIDVANRVVSCQLLNSFPVTTPFVLLITYGPFPNNCEMYTNNSITGVARPGNTITLNLIEDVTSGTVYCYTVSVSYGSDALIINGLFRSICNPEELKSNPNSEETVTIPNGRVIYDGVTPGSMAVLTCDSGYEPDIGSSTRICMTDGNWSGNQHRCMAIAFPVAWLVAVIVIVVIVVLGALFTVVFGVACFFSYRRKKKTRQESQCAVYEDPDSLPSDPKTAGNLAYEHVGGSGKKSTELKGPLYEEVEDIKPQPHTQGNLAYGHVQFQQ